MFHVTDIPIHNTGKRDIAKDYSQCLLYQEPFCWAVTIIVIICIVFAVLQIHILVLLQATLIISIWVLVNTLVLIICLLYGIETSELKIEPKLISFSTTEKRGIHRKRKIIGYIQLQLHQGSGRAGSQKTVD